MVLETYVREGEAAHEAVTDQNLCLGPFSLSQEDLVNNSLLTTLNQAPDLFRVSFIIECL